MSLDHAIVFLFEVFLNPFIYAGVGVFVISIGLVLLLMAARLLK
jgi:hypothetical protein